MEPPAFSKTIESYSTFAETITGWLFQLTANSSLSTFDSLVHTKSKMKLTRNPTRRAFLARLEKEVADRGVVDVLRHGIKH